MAESPPMDASARRDLGGGAGGDDKCEKHSDRALERAFPLRVLRYRLRRGSGGAGLASGGEGIDRDLRCWLMPRCR